MATETLHTKFGNARLNSSGHYQITSSKEGNWGKMLHRLIFEDFYQCDLDEMFPEGIVIHHEDEDKTNNNIWNLVPMTPSEHRRLHGTGATWNVGKPHSQERKHIESKAKSTTGYYKVYKAKTSRCRQGFIYRYSYFENGKHKSLSSVDLKKLEEKVRAKGLEWTILDEDKAKECN